ncbi:MAG: aspartate carbamoyltransferase [bacterium]|nr:aspartate carbamoyltransferase [bacterium]
MNHILAGKQFADKKLLEKILKRAGEFEVAVKKGKVQKLLSNKIVACIFFEPSTRTRLSFEAAALRLGAQVISAENAMQDSSAYKGESIEDTTKMVCSYADVVIIRHPEEGTVERAAKVASKPIINAGDGGNEHPSQAVLDLYTIKKHLGRLDNLNIAFGFDPKHSRTIKSLALILSHFKNNNFTFVCPKALNPTPAFLEELKKSGVKFTLTENLSKFKEYDIFYANRLQGERFKDKKEFEKYRKALILTKELVKGTKTLILDPLPRIDEIEVAVDDLPNALYFDQAQNGLYVRMALLLYALGM